MIQLYFIQYKPQIKQNHPFLNIFTTTLSIPTDFVRKSIHPQKTLELTNEYYGVELLLFQSKAVDYYAD
ncbi:hypothetical protein M595_4447 [Lyngbya aestuarii BL J]|uniref:Uncharacterized protein n=1 Tax=Lyngbya aestuarii BL J TaxID=1348334 RepID=U7QGP4_9CYAN|nr:hypothetical protein M595_4447 [Lyngbya aestuarii BL J]